MLCDTSSPKLKSFLDGELGPVAAWRLRRHLRRCPACAAEYQALQQFHALLRAADIVPPDAVRVPETPPLPRHTPAAWKLAGGALVTGALTLALFVLPTWHRTPRTMSDAVASALAEVNTWHLSGWKQINGQRVPWDVWGRRAPFLFYEKVGDDITFDDGTQRLRLYPPAPALHRPTGLVIRTASLKHEFDAGGPSVEDMVGLWNWRQGAGGFAPTPYRRTASTVGFRLQYPLGVGYGVNANQLYTINRFTWLPEQYQLQFSTDKFHRDVEDLSADYDVVLPGDVTTPPVPVGYSRVNFVGDDGLGLTVQATPMDVDRVGNILIRVRSRLGDVPMTPGSTFTLTVGDYNAPLYGSQSNTVRSYLPMDVNGYQYTSPQGDTLLWLAPLDPRVVASNTLDALHLTVSASVNVQNQATDFVDLHNQPYSRSQPETLLTKPFPFALPLSREPTVNDIQTSSAWPASWRRKQWPLAYYVHQARADSYYLASFGSQGDVQRQKRGIAVYWLQREIATLPNTPQGRDWRLITLEQLALYQKAAGQTAASRQTLRQIIAGYQGMSEYGVLRRQAEYALRTGQFPSDTNYKGPS